MSKGVKSYETKCKTFEIKHFQSYLNKKMFKTCQNIVNMFNLKLTWFITKLNSFNTLKNGFELFETGNVVLIEGFINLEFYLKHLKSENKKKKCSTTRTVF